jgi:hypothetical protein
MRRKRISSRPAAVSNRQGAVLAYDRNRERPILPADDQHGLTRALHHHLMLGVVGLNNAIARRRIGDRVAGGHDVGAISAQHSQNAFPVVGLGRAHEGIDGLLRGFEGLLGVCHRPHRERKDRRDQRGQSCQG